MACARLIVTVTALNWQMVQISASNLLTHRIAAVFNVQNSRKTPNFVAGTFGTFYSHIRCTPSTLDEPHLHFLIGRAIGRASVPPRSEGHRYKLAPNGDGAGALRAEVRLDTDLDRIRAASSARAKIAHGTDIVYRATVARSTTDPEWKVWLEINEMNETAWKQASPPHLLLHSSTLNAPASAFTSSTYSTLANGFTSSIYSTPTNGIQTQAGPQEAQTGTKPLKAGIEGIVNGVIELEEMVLTMRGNKGDLVKLKKHLDALDAVDCSNMEGDLKQRVETLKKELHPIITDHNQLVKRTKIMGFVNSKEDKEVIQNIQNSIISCIQDFTFHGAISIEKLVGDLTPQVQEIQKNVDTMTPQVQEIQRNVDTMTPQVQEIQRNVGSMAPQVDQVQQKAILADLKYIPAQYNAANTPDTCMKGTRVQILKDVLTHLTLTGFSKQIVMLSGSAGSGKSTIAKTVAQILAEEKHILAVSFFFSRHHAERRELDFLPTTLALQLADYSSYFRNCLVDLLHKDHTRILFSDPKEQFQKLVVD
ncbi:hypothetical protein B0H16DRAFT_1690613, partial [Mycena metata]